jgi:hypothetical protein
MNDPHVVKLFYRVVAKENADYSKAPALFDETENFRMVLNSKTAVFEMKKHFPTVEDAIIVVDDYLSRWNVLIDIEHSPDELRLKFERADVVDRSPSMNSSQTGTANIIIPAVSTLACTLTLCVHRVKFPNLPRRFAISPDVETLYTRYRAYRQNQESLLSMAYTCLTVLEASVGLGTKKRKRAAVKYNIDESVLNKLGKLCTEKGTNSKLAKRPRMANMFH